MYKNLALKLLTVKLKEPQPCGTHFKSWINAEGISSLPFYLCRRWMFLKGTCFFIAAVLCGLLHTSG